MSTAESPRRITTPLTDEIAASLRIGDQVLLSGAVLGARDTVHRLLTQAIHDRRPLPVDLTGQVIYYVGPTPARSGQAVGSAGPTTSERMDPYTPALLAQGLRGMIGKGARGQFVREAIRRYRAVYFVAIGGAGALAAQSIVRAEIVAFERLGPEALWRFEFKDFPLIVANDIYGGDLFTEGVAKYARQNTAEKDSAETRS